MRAQTQYTAQPGASKRTLLQLLLERAVQPDRIAAKQKRNGVWEDATWGRVLEEVRKLSAALVAEGIRPGDKVAIFAATSLQWVICDLAIGAARAVAV
ncbi:MAG TPA: AMP-binding protein, partial [Myxococcaceae bacterium]|nr:AMP-binding protein [Myxococcaceae bacterium]